MTPSLKGMMVQGSQCLVGITYIKVKVAQSCPTLCYPTDYTVHGILQTRILEWVAFPFSRGSFQLRDWTQVSLIAGEFFTSWVTRKTQEYWNRQPVSPLTDLPNPEIEPGSPAFAGRFFANWAIREAWKDTPKGTLKSYSPRVPLRKKMKSH